MLREIEMLRAENQSLKNENVPNYTALAKENSILKSELQ
jgi:hypothetical protein